MSAHQLAELRPWVLGGPRERVEGGHDGHAAVRRARRHVALRNVAHDMDLHGEQLTVQRVLAAHVVQHQTRTQLLVREERKLVP